MAAQTFALRRFCNCDLGINSMTLKLEGNPDILKMYLYAENEVELLA